MSKFFLYFFYFINIKTAIPSNKQYIPKYFKFPFLTTFKNHLRVKYETTNDAMKPKP